MHRKYTAYLCVIYMCSCVFVSYNISLKQTKAAFGMIPAQAPKRSNPPPGNCNLFLHVSSRVWLSLLAPIPMYLKHFCSCIPQIQLVGKSWGCFRIQSIGIFDPSVS